VSTVAVTVEMEALTCCTCSMLFAVPKTWMADRRKDQKWFHCPNGHSQHFPAKCPVCGKKLKDTRSIAGHMKRMHAEKAGAQ
jgi:uncharacterized C2H2 Zn-finger protein